MLILGLVLLLAAVALTAGMLLGNTGNVVVDVFGYESSSFSMGELFVIGVVTGIIAGLSLALVLSGMRRSSRKRRERRTELKTKQSREQELQEENARLARELDQQRQSGVSTDAAGSTAIPGSTNTAAHPDEHDRSDGHGQPEEDATWLERPAGAPSAPPVSTQENPPEGRRPLG